jgi:hypothetical protein
VSKEQPHQHFNAYYHDNAILIQLIVAEFVTTYHLACEMEHLTHLALQSEQTFKQHVNLMFQHINQILGTAYENDRLPLSRWKKGPLTKLKDYSEQLARNSKHQDHASVALFNQVDRTWLSALYNLELLGIMQPSNEQFPLIANWMMFKRGLNQLNRCFVRIAKFLPAVISNHCENENVLFFLLRKKDDLKRIYGNNFIQKLMRKRFTHPSHITHLINQRYSARGFTHLLPKMNYQYA